MKHLDKIRHVIPKDGIGTLKDMATQVVCDDARLEGSVALGTARSLGEQLRLLNSYHSNRIEGHKTGILDIRKALRGEFKPESHGRYNQELCAAHVVTERRMMERLRSEQVDPFEPGFLPSLHKGFYGELPSGHQYCHSSGGFTSHRVMPGRFRDRHVSVDGEHQLGPDPEDVSGLYGEILRLYSPRNHHGDERLIAILASHHRLTWLHPFRDGNGRMIRLHTTAALAHVGVNRCNLWSLSRGFSRVDANHFAYQVNLQDADNFTDESLADFVQFCLEQCLDQIAFIGQLLDVNAIEGRIERYFRQKLPQVASLFPGGGELGKVLKNEKLVRLMCAVFRSGAMARGEAYEILGVQRKRGVEIIKPLLQHGLLRTDSERGPLLFGFPEEAMPEYFPYLYKPSLMVETGVEAEGIVVRDGEEVKLALEDGSLRTIGRWTESFRDILGKKATRELLLKMIQAAIPGGDVLKAFYEMYHDRDG